MPTQKTTKKLIPIIGLYAPVTLYFILFLLSNFIAYSWLKSRALIPNTPFSDIFNLLLDTTFWLSFYILAFSLLSAILPWLYALIQIKRNIFKVNIQSSIDIDNRINITIHPIIKPLLGFIKLRLIYDETDFSAKFQLTEIDKKSTFLSQKIKGYYLWELPEIREYKIEKVVLYFEDVFQFFSFPIWTSAFERFNSIPKEALVASLSPVERTTENILNRIDIIKKVDGELFNFKDFENDDIRRIVWKIYAKNKNLVVRSPESLDPFTSHVYLYASFYSDFDTEKSDTIHIPFLNYYKTMVWNFFLSLKKKQFNVRFISDQSDKYILSTDIESDKKLQHLISVSTWQTKTDLKNYISEKDLSVLIISSLNKASKVKEILKTLDPNVKIIFIPLSESLQNQKAKDWIEWIFLDKSQDNIAQYKMQWFFNPLKYKILENEKQLTALFENHFK